MIVIIESNFVGSNWYFPGELYEVKKRYQIENGEKYFRLKNPVIDKNDPEINHFLIWVNHAKICKNNQLTLQIIWDVPIQ